MWEPLLDDDLFTRDGVLLREPLFRVDDLNKAEGAEPHDDAVRFTGARRLTVKLTCASPDLSRFNLLALRLRNDGPKPLLVGVTLIHGSESRGRDIPDVSLTGGRALLGVGESTELLFPVEDFGSYGFPVGWTDIREIQISFGHEKTEFEPGPIDIRIYGAVGEYRDYPKGPRLSDVGLAHVIDVSGSSPSLRDACFSACPGGSAAGVPPPHPYPRHTAGDILGGLIMGRRLPLPIPWDANPTGELEWRHFLHRHHFLRPVVAAYRETREALFASFLRNAMTHWIESNPAPVGSNGGAGPAWETLSVAWRLREWFYAIDALIAGDELDDDTARLLLRSIWEHARSLMDHQGHPTNWLIVESAALALAGFRFPCFREDQTWRETAVDRLTEEAARQFFSDGVHFEISPLYHGICVTACLEVNETAQAVGRPLPDTFSRAVERSFEYLAALCRPDFTWPSINDSGSMDGDFTALMGWGGRAFDRPDLVWIGSKGTEGSPPTRRTYLFDQAGIGVLRSSHEADAHHLILRAGPPGAGHAHEDSLSLELTASGLPRLVDPGITAYAPGPLTDYYRSADAHSMLLIDGKGATVGDSCPYARQEGGLRPSPPPLPEGEGVERPSGVGSLPVGEQGIGELSGGPTPEEVIERRQVERGSLPGGEGAYSVPRGGSLPGGEGVERPPREALSFPLSPWERVRVREIPCALSQGAPVSSAHPCIDPAGPSISVRQVKDQVILSGDSGYRVSSAGGDYRRTRTAIFADGAYWIVVDRVEGRGKHDLTVCWQFAPSCVEIDIDTYAARVDDMRGAFEIIPLFGRPRPVVEIFTGSLSPPRGWVSVGGADVPAPQVRYSVGALLPVRLMWILYAYRDSPMRPASAFRKDLNSGEIEIVVRHPIGDEDRVTFDAGGEFTSMERFPANGFPIRSSLE